LSFHYAAIAAVFRIKATAVVAAFVVKKNDAQENKNRQNQTRLQDKGAINKAFTISV